MVSRVGGSSDVLTQLEKWGDEQIQTLLIEYRDIDAPTFEESEDVSQGVIFCQDFNRHVHNTLNHFQYEVASLVQCVAMVALAPFAIVVELTLFCSGSIEASRCLTNICVVPKHIISTIFKAAIFVLRVIDKTVTAAATGTGFLVWHSGECIVRLINGAEHTILSTKQYMKDSNTLYIRDIVYYSLGLTLLASSALFVPVAAIQMVALPIIMGSIYGTINNQFTTRQCPEYYTMGNGYDGTDLKNHAIKTNNLLIKPVVTGCYATTMVTKFAGVVLATVARAPYTAAVLPVSLAATMISVVLLVSLVAAHLFSIRAKESIQSDLEEYAALIDIEWTEENRNQTWSDLAELRQVRIQQKREELAHNSQELAEFNQRLHELTKNIDSAILDPQMPVKYIEGWQANNTRDLVGYIFAGGGTLGLSISAVFLRIFVL